MKKQYVAWLRSSGVFSIAGILFLTSCGEDGGESDPKPEPEPEVATITINPAFVKQEMIGFGGALTWYSDWVTGNAKKEEIADLIFGDLGIDIIRFKNWYYPDNYPATTSTDVMTDDYARQSWVATNELYDLAKARNPNVKILLSSWGPPKSLKNNNSPREGTLKKDGANFMYDAYADYWEHVLDNVPFDPDYISIQNEPTYVNSGWTTCQWAASETASLPDYHTAFDKLYDKIKSRAYVPVMIGPESQDVPTFSAFANILKNKAHCGIYAFHPYNINSGTSSDQVVASLQTIGSFNTKPNIMTEFSDNLDWYNTALFIHRSLVYANSSGYIYWKLGWSTPTSGTNAGMISVGQNATSQYVVTPYYYLIKHFSKYIDSGYHRVEATSSNISVYTTAFISPDNSKITLVIINDGAVEERIKLTVTGKTATGISTFQSTSGTYYKTVEVNSPADAITLPSKSITTIVLNI